MANCPKCGSGVLLDHLRVRGHYYLGVVAFRNPDALLFTEPVCSGVEATVCGGCGYTELFATNPKILVEAMAVAKERSRRR